MILAWFTLKRAPIMRHMYRYDEMFINKRAPIQLYKQSCYMRLMTVDKEEGNLPDIQYQILYHSFSDYT